MYARKYGTGMLLLTDVTRIQAKERVVEGKERVPEGEAKEKQRTGRRPPGLQSHESEGYASVCALWMVNGYVYV
jgi:hypothetical protein